MSDHRVNERVEFGLAFASTRNTFNVHVRVRVIAASIIRQDCRRLIQVKLKSGKNMPLKQYMKIFTLPN